MKKTTKKTNKS